MWLVFLTLFFFIQAQSWTRDDAVRVANAWEAGNVPYSQSTTYHTLQFVSSGKGPYRSDCSGFVSAAWNLAPPGFTTSTIPHNSIDSSQLIRGDALLNPSHHIALFWGWADSSQTKPIVVEEYSTGHFCEQRTWSSLRGFLPIRRQGWDGTPPGGGGGGGGNAPVPVPVGGGGGGGGATCTVTASSLNLRSCGSTTCSIVSVLSNGDQVTTTSTTSGSWVRLSSPSGWVSSSYLDCSGNNNNFRLSSPDSAVVADNAHVNEGDGSAKQVSTPDSNQVGLIVGVVLAAAIVVCLVAVTIYLLAKRNAHSEMV